MASWTRRSFLRAVGTATVGGLASTVLSACGSAPTQAPADAGGATAPAQQTGSGEKRVVNALIQVGALGQLVIEQVIPKIEAECNCTFKYTQAPTVQQLTLLKAQANDAIDLVMIADSAVWPARADNLLQKLNENNIPNLKKLKPGFLYGEGYAAAWMSTPFAPMFNTEHLSEPTSWSVLWDPTYKQRIAIPPISYSSALSLVVIAAGLELGLPVEEAQYKAYDAGFKRLKEMKPNLLTIYSDATTANRLLFEGEAWIVPHYGSFVWPSAPPNAPIGVANRVEERVVNQLSAMEIPAKAKHVDIAEAFINYVLSQDIQQQVAGRFKVVPANSETKIPAEVMSLIPEDKQVASLDWQYLGAERPKWTERWNAEMGG